MIDTDRNINRVSQALVENMQGLMGLQLYHRKPQRSGIRILSVQSTSQDQCIGILSGQPHEKSEEE